MVYQGRIVIAGNYGGNMFAGVVLQSRSEQDRIIRPWHNGANIVPSEAKLQEVIEQLGMGDLAITHNSYPGVFGFGFEPSNRYVVGCNGRFAGAIRRKISRGDSLDDAIDVAFDASDPKSGDPRLVAVVHQFDGGHHFYLGAFDIVKPPYWVSEVQIDRNTAKYIASNSKGEIREIGLNGVSFDKLAMYLFTQTLGENPEFGIGAAVCILEPEGFKIDVFNARK